MTNESYNFSNDYQDAVLACRLRHPNRFAGHPEVFQPRFFSGLAACEVAFAIKEYEQKYGHSPSFKVLANYVFQRQHKSNPERAKESVEYVQKLSRIDTTEVDYILDTVCDFARERAVLGAMNKVLAAQQSGKEVDGGIVKLFEDAVAIGQPSDSFFLLEDIVESEPDAAAVNLVGNGFIRRGGTALLVGPTGVGKSSLMLQAAVCFAAGIPFFGIKPERPLQILIVQAENDEIDLREMALGVLDGLGLLESDRDALLRLACDNLVIMTETVASGDAFISALDATLMRAHSDLCIIDPLFSFVGGSVSDQEVVSKFCRGGLNSIAKRRNLGFLVAHHTNKARAGEKKGPQLEGTELAYLMSGHNELANWPRGILTLQPIGGSFDVFRLTAAKRGDRAGLADANGSPVRSINIKHAEQGICWHYASGVEVDAAASAQNRHREDAALGAVRRNVPIDGEITPERLMMCRGDVSEKRFRSALKVLIERGEVVEREEQRGRRKFKFFKRNPQVPSASTEVELALQ